MVFHSYVKLPDGIASVLNQIFSGHLGSLHFKEHRSLRPRLGVTQLAFVAHFLVILWQNCKSGPEIDARGQVKSYGLVRSDSSTTEDCWKPSKTLTNSAQ